MGEVCGKMHGRRGWCDRGSRDYIDRKSGSKSHMLLRKVSNIIFSSIEKGLITRSIVTYTILKKFERGSPTHYLLMMSFLLKLKCPLRSNHMIF